MAKRIDSFCTSCGELIEYQGALGEWVHLPVAGAHWIECFRPTVGWTARLRVKLDARRRRRLLRRWAKGSSALVVLALILAGTAGSVAANPYPTEYRTCVAAQWDIFEQQWQDLLAKYPKSELARKWYRDRSPGSYEQALADPRTTQACPLEGGER